MSPAIPSAVIVAVAGIVLWAVTGVAPGWAWTASVFGGVVLGSLPDLLDNRKETP